MPTRALTPELIAAAIEGFTAQRHRLDTQIAELRAMLPGSRSIAEATATSEAPTGKRKQFSAASRRKMALAQKERWRRIHGESEPPAPTTGATKPKRKLSKQGRANIVAALKARWAAKKAGTSATAKKVAPARKETTAKKGAAKGPRAKAKTTSASASSTQAAG